MLPNTTAAYYLRPEANPGLAWWRDAAISRYNEKAYYSAGTFLMPVRLLGGAYNAGGKKTAGFPWFVRAVTLK